MRNSKHISATVTQKIQQIRVYSYLSIAHVRRHQRDPLWTARTLYDSCLVWLIIALLSPTLSCRKHSPWKIDDKRSAGVVLSRKQFNTIFWRSHVYMLYRYRSPLSGKAHESGERNVKAAPQTGPWFAEKLAHTLSVIASRPHCIALTYCTSHREALEWSEHFWSALRINSFRLKTKSDRLLVIDWTLP